MILSQFDPPPSLTLYFYTPLLMLSYTLLLSLASGDFATCFPSKILYASLVSISNPSWPPGLHYLNIS